MRSLTAPALLARMRRMRNPRNIAGMARFGINPRGTLGISVAVLRRMARASGKNHALAGALWRSGIHEARILAALVEEPEKITSVQMDRWVAQFDSWDVCDQVCANAFDRTPYAYRKAVAWSRRRQAFVKRAGFVLMATLAVHDKRAPDAAFAKLFPRIRAGASDGRNFVKKAVNWALRQIGKRNRRLHRQAVACAQRLRRLDVPSARWIASDALREWESPAVRRRLARAG